MEREIREDNGDVDGASTGETRGYVKIYFRRLRRSGKFYMRLY